MLSILCQVYPNLKTQQQLRHKKNVALEDETKFSKHSEKYLEIFIGYVYVKMT